MQPRDIQVWTNEDTCSSVSSLDLDSDSDSEDDEEDHVRCGVSRTRDVEATLDRLTQRARGRKSLTHHVRPNSKRYSRTTSDLTASQSTKEPCYLNSPMRKFMSDTSDNNLTASRSFQSQQRKLYQAKEWNSHLNSPMRKFRSNTDVSDGNFCASRSFQCQRRQVNAKWNVSADRKIRQHSLLTQMPLGLSPKQLSDCVAKSLPEAAPEGSVCSKESRWRTSTRPLGGTSIIRRPRRHQSEVSLSHCSLDSADSDHTSVVAPKKRRGRRPAPFVKPAKNTEENQATEEKKASSEAIQEQQDDTPQSTEEKLASSESMQAEEGDPPASTKEKMASAEVIQEAQGDTPEEAIIHQQSLRRQSLMSQVIRNVTSAAQICEEDGMIASCEQYGNLPPSVVPPVDLSSLAPAHRCVKQRPCRSLVSMMSSFHPLSPPRHHLTQTETSSSPVRMESDALAKGQSTTSMSDLKMNKPQRRGSATA